VRPLGESLLASWDVRHGSLPLIDVELKRAGAAGNAHALRTCCSNGRQVHAQAMGVRRRRHDD
jgi:hypothetical protein